MSTVGYRAKNHPLQVAGRGALDEVDDRGTPLPNFAEFDRQHGPFTIDVAAAPHNAKCERFYTRADDGLRQPWTGERVWCNPPFSDLEPWVRKAWSEWAGTLGIVMLLPSNRTEQVFWQKLIEPRRDRPGSPLRVEFLPSRIRFITPGADGFPDRGRPPFGCCLLIWTGGLEVPS